MSILEFSNITGDSLSKNNYLINGLLNTNIFITNLKVNNIKNPIIFLLNSKLDLNTGDITQVDLSMTDAPAFYFTDSTVTILKSILQDTRLVD